MEDKEYGKDQISVCSAVCDSYGVVLEIYIWFTYITGLQEYSQDHREGSGSKTKSTKGKVLELVKFCGMGIDLRN